jgi:hypothetical protein
MSTFTVIVFGFGVLLTHAMVAVIYNICRCCSLHVAEQQEVGGGAVGISLPEAPGISMVCFDKTEVLHLT